MTQTALATDLELTKVAIGGLLDRMETVGLVQRRFDENDARIRRVYLTRGGNKLVRDIANRWSRSNSRFSGRIARKKFGLRSKACTG
jgi:DNA-binding MarR family transcriptional regulator